MPDGIQPGIIAGWIHQHIQDEFKSKLRVVPVTPKRIGIYSDGAGYMMFKNDIGG